MSETRTTTGAVAGAGPGESAPDEAWRGHVAAAEKFRGSNAEYCRRHGLDAKTFRVQKKKYYRRLHAEKIAAASAFVKIEPQAAAPTARAKERELPDPRWTAEFLAALLKSLR